MRTYVRNFPNVAVLRKRAYGHVLSVREVLPARLKMDLYIGGHGIGVVIRDCQIIRAARFFLTSVWY